MAELSSAARSLLNSIVAQLGGHNAVTKNQSWEEVAKRMNLPASHSQYLKTMSLNKEDEEFLGEEEGNEFEVEDIVRHRKDGKQILYFVKWKGFESSENTWEPESNLINCIEKLRVYKENNQEKRPGKRQRIGSLSESNNKSPINTIEENTLTMNPNTSTSSVSCSSSSNAILDETATFQTNEPDSILGAANSPENGICFLVKWKGDEERYSWMPVSECRRSIPNLLLDYYETRLTFSSACTNSFRKD
eukprot:c8613_g1_i1.p1 GENE.c8613_g1_i1~~c8613_g1_i1.p1  ORF type:complete len:248 (-),score=66.73 c8613_g1_i1:71-814(-)